jgi:hypothetical protein
MKNCSKCGEEKGLSEFGKDKRNKDGLLGQCRVCVAEKRKAYSKAYYEANKEKKKASSKAYYEANRENQKAYREANKEKLKKRRKTHYETNKEKIVENQKAYNEANKEKRKAYNEANRENIKAYREASRKKRIEELKQIIEPNTDDKWIYILQCGLYNKIGISNDPLRRIPELEKKTGFEIKLLYLAKANYGRTVDTERVIHHDLKEFNIPIPYKTKGVSREWFYGDLEHFIEVISKYCEVEAVSINTTFVS